MNGPEHYREAESSLVAAKGSDGGSNLERYHLAAAQVHATLALAAATAMAAAPTHPDEPVGMVPADFIAWQKVAGIEQDGA